MSDEKGEMVSFCHHSPVERHWVKDNWGERRPEDICLKCWKPCELINTNALEIKND